MLLIYLPPQVCLLPSPQLLFCLFGYSLVAQVFFLPFPQLLLCLFTSNLPSCRGFHFHSFCRQQHQGMPCPSTSCLALEPNMDVCTKVIEPLVVVPNPKVTHLIVNIDDEDSQMEK